MAATNNSKQNNTISVNDIVSDKLNGFAIVTEVSQAMSTSIATIKFTNGDKKRYLSDYLTKVSTNLIRNIKYEEFERKYSYNSKERGFSYYCSGNVKEVDYTEFPRSVSSFIKGSGRNMYTTIAYFDQDGLKNTICSCPVGSNCKHGAALMYYLSEQIRLLSAFNPATENLEINNDDINPEQDIEAMFTGYTIRKNDIDYALKILSQYANEYKFKYSNMIGRFIYISYSIAKSLKNDILSAIDKMDNSGILRAIIDSYLSSRYYQNYHYVLSSKVNYSMSVDELFDFFNVRYTVDRFENKVALHISVMLDRVSFFEILYCNDKIDVNTIVSGEFGEQIASSLVKTLLEKDDNIKIELDLIRRIIEEEERQRKLEKIKSDFSLLCSDVYSKKIILSNDDKASLEFSFNIKPLNRYDTFRHYWEYDSLELRIGLNKKYVVKNIANLVGYFNERKTYKYGKNFEFTHDLENIVPSQREAVKILTMYASTPYNTDGRELNLDQNITESLINSLKGTEIFVNNCLYDVKLQEVECSIKVDKSYNILFTMPCSQYFLSLSGDTLFVFDMDKMVVNYIPSTKEDQKLYIFAYLNNGNTIEHIKRSFRDEIYSRFIDKIQIDEEIKSSFKLSELKIKAYFDYTNKKIVVKTKFYKEDAEISPEKLTTSSDIHFADRYYTYLSALGFSENEMLSESDIINFFSMDMTELKKYCEVYLSDSIMNKTVQSFRTQNIVIQRDGSMMEAFIEESEYSDEELKAILKAVRQKKKYILLSNDRIVTLNNEDANEFESSVSELGLSEDKLSVKKQLPVQKALRAIAHEKGCKIDDYLYRMLNDIKGFKTYDALLPRLTATLRPYQEEGFRWLKVLSDYNMGGILADDMGLGKTLETIALIKSDQTKMPSLVVCPKSLVYNWENEFKRFDNETEVIPIYGGVKEREDLLNNIDVNKKTVIITSYDSLRNDLDNYNFSFNYLILDEAQYIKNVNARKSKTVKEINALHRFALTGTPIENNAIDLWSIFDFIMPGYLDNLSDFKSRFNSGDGYTEKVSTLVAPFILRRTKGEVLKDLPEKYEKIVTADMTVNQRKIYEAYRMEAKEAMDNGEGAFEILPYLMKLRQICDSPSIFAEGYENESGKMTVLDELLDEYIENDHRMLIFSQFVKTLDMIGELLVSKKIKYLKITGDTSAEKRIDYMNAFNASNDYKVFIISLKAGGTGLNLTGADTVIHFDPWWNAAAENQASDRAHRIGQTKNVEVIKLICEDSIEQKVIELQNMKKDLIDKLISNDDKSVTGINLEDIKYVLSR